MSIYDPLKREDKENVDALVERLRKIDVTRGDMVRMAAYEWYDMIGEADVDI